ncbi:SMC4 [[Candida] subhashii]|uniref:Structural maintenance of chromosomes protein n=1 Tax=[Candida] subhashii TaxID=561895 RepID=A0A8J5QJY6_9ASCO|nr:SMC4 [[Candida] subhashii]KAG7663523.1 SMC4 [[Candida] subhashii]
MKRKRVIASGSEDESSFVNNSDYDDSKEVSVNDAVATIKSESQQMLPNDQQGEDEGQIEKSEAEPIENNEADIILDNGEDSKLAEMSFHSQSQQDNQGDSQEQVAENKVEKVENGEEDVITNHEEESKLPDSSFHLPEGPILKRENVFSDLKLEASTSQPNSGENMTGLEDDKSDIESTMSPIRSSTLSYSQQQNEVLKQSPSKRKEVKLPIPRTNEPRLVIDKLVLTNFKSYAGVQTIGPFNSSFSAVVGPNGSGKSNVIDSMLFVFGFRASKMRQGKLKELIHNSGDEKPQYCQVDIHFKMVLDDPAIPQKAETIPNSELVISRKAFQTNQSSYYINGKGSSYTEVTTLLKGQGIDLDHKRFLILQGEVESIAQMKAKAEKDNDDGLLEYLEDIIGTTKYKSLIEESMQRIEELNEVCMEKANRFDLVEKDKNQLEEKKTEALRFLEMEKQLINAKSVHFQVSIYESQKKIDIAQKEADELNKELEEKRQENQELLSGIEAELKKQKLIEDSIKELGSQIDKLGKQKKETTRKGVTMEEKSKNLNSKLKKINKTLETSQHNLSSSTQKLSNYSDASEQFKIEVEKLNSQLEVEEVKLDEIRQSLTAKTSEFTKEIEILQKTLEPWNDKIKAKNNAIKLATSNIELLRQQMNSTTKQLDEAKERLSSIKKEGKEKEAEYRDTEEKLEKIEEQIGLGEEQCSIEKNKLENMKSSLISQRQKVQESTNIFNNSQNKNKVLAHLLRLVKSGRIEGFHGRLGDLGVIDEKYDVAISTAAGAGLDSMVVETVETAQACINYLRKNKLGYANFICLNKLRNFNVAPIQTPGDPAKVKRLFDLIQPTSAKFAPAFYSKVYNTLVAPDLTEAKKVAYGAKRWKVVTLDGKVVDTSGTMSGGGNYTSKGAMRLSNSRGGNDPILTEEELQEMREKLHSMESNFEKANVEYEQKVSMLKKLKDLKPDTEFALSRLRLDIQSLASEKKEISQVCKNLIIEQEKMEQSNPFEQQIAEKEKEVEQWELERSELKSEMLVHEQQIKVLEQKIMDAGGVELKMQNSKVDSLKQQLEIIHDKTSGDRMTIKKLENDIKRLTKIIEASTQEQHDAQVELESLQKQERENSERLQEIESELNKLNNSKTEKDDELETLKNEVDGQQEEINKFKQFEVEVLHKLEKCNGYIKKLNLIIEEKKNELDALVVRDTQEYILWLDAEEQKKYNGTEIESLTEEEIRDVDLEVTDDKIKEIEQYMATVKVDIEVLKEYGTKLVEYNTRKVDLNTAVEERDEKKDYCEDLKRKRLDEFMVGFNTISMTLKDMYRMITMGGNAELELVDSLDPFSEGILFSVMPPKKSWKNISNLSGGEKTLSSLALVFALHQYKPTPLYVMDEIDAALDFRNVSIVANYIKERTKNAQFVVISLRNNMFELAQQLVGIYKVNNKTESVSIGNIDIVDLIKA